MSDTGRTAIFTRLKRQALSRLHQKEHWIDLQLSGKTIIVTGAGSGIGRATALSLAQEDTNLVLADIKKEGTLETIKLIKAQHPQATAISVQADTARPEDHERIVQAALHEFSSLHGALTTPESAAK